MVFLFVLIFPYIGSVFWSGDYIETNSSHVVNEFDGRIIVKEVTSGMDTEMPLEEYLYGYLPTVIPIEYELECLKAQAIILRTQLIASYKEKAQEGQSIIEATPGNYLSNNQLKKIWGDNYYINSEKIRQAIEETKGVYLTYGGEPIQACFFRVSAGVTRDGTEILGNNYPYIKSVSCPKDYLSESYLSQIKIKKKELEEVLGGQIEEIQMDQSGYCKNVIILKQLDKNTTTMINVSGEQFRQTFNLSSASFIIEEKKTNIIFKVKGLGHGLGMSQFGANEKAKDGADYGTILNYFYENIYIDKYQ